MGQSFMVRPQLGLFQAHIKFRGFRAQVRPTKINVWALMFDWPPIKRDKIPTRQIKLIQIIQGSIQNRIHEIWIICSCVNDNYPLS